MNKFLAVFFLMATSGFSMAADKPDCTFSVEDLDANFSNLLYRDDDYRAAGALLDKQNNCKPDNYYKAVIVDLNAQIIVYLFRITKDGDGASKAEESFNLALNLNTKRNESIYYHLSILKRDTSNLDDAIKYIKKAIEIGGDHSPRLTEYLAFNLVLSVETESWDEAKKLTNLLINRDRHFYFSLPALLASVKTLCHYGRWDVAKQFVDDVEGQREHLMINSEREAVFDHAKEVVQSCTPTSV